jgi:predicted PurR-regulated permease PerM
MKKNGFISVTVIYTFFLVFLSLMLYIVTNLVVNRNLLNNMKTTIKNELNDSNFNRYLINHCNDLIRMDDSYNNSIKDNSYRFPKHK